MPLHIQLEYVTDQEQDRRILWSFTHKTGGTCGIRNGWRDDRYSSDFDNEYYANITVPHNEWYSFTSEDAKAIDPAMARLTWLGILGNGWDRDSRIDNIHLSMTTPTRAPTAVDDHGDTPSGSTLIPVSSEWYGSIEDGDDVDFFSFRASGGHEYVIETHLDSNPDTVLALYDPAGDVIDHHDDSGSGGGERMVWVAPSTDTYYIEVMGYEGATGTYFLTLIEVATPAPTAAPARVADDHGDTPSGSTLIPVSSEWYGSIEDGDDVDFFSFRASGGHEYVIETHLDSNPDTVLALYDPAGDVIDHHDDSGSGGGERMVWVAPSTDTYYIEVMGYEGATGTYFLTLIEVATPAPTAAPAPVADDHGDTPSGSTLIPVSSEWYGSIEDGDDVDFFSFRASGGHEYVIETHLDSNPDTVLALYDPAGDVIDHHDDSGSGGGERMVWVAPSTDTYYIEVMGYEGATGTYFLTLIEVATPAPTAAPAPVADDHGDTPSGSTLIPVSSEWYGSIEDGDDVDFFSFRASGGHEYVIETHLDSNPDTVLALYDPAGDVIDHHDDSGSGGGERMVWVAPSTDTYYIEVMGYEGATGTYFLTLIEVATPAPTAAPAPVADDHGDTPSGSTLIPVSSEWYGSIEDGDDVDFFSFRASGGHEYVIETHLDSNPDTVLALYDPAGDVIDHHDDSGSGGGERMVWVAPSTDTYYIEVMGYEGATGTYFLTLIEVATPAPTPSPSPTARPRPHHTPTPVPLPTAVPTSLPTNGDFSNGSDGWTIETFIGCGSHSEVRFLGQDGPNSNVVQFIAEGNGGCYTDAKLLQILDIEVPANSQMVVSADVKSVHSAVRGPCGDTGSEMPLHIQLEYVTDQEQDRRILWSFTHKTGGTCGIRNGWRDDRYSSDFDNEYYANITVPHNEWYSFTSEDAKAIDPAMARLTWLGILGNGWDRDSRIDNIHLSMTTPTRAPTAVDDHGDTPSGSTVSGGDKVGRAGGGLLSIGDLIVYRLP